MNTPGLLTKHTSANHTRDALLHHIDFRAMGCAMEAWVLTSDTQQADERLQLIHNWMAWVDTTLSRFQPDSELSKLNARPGLPVLVSPLLWDALAWALRAAEMTEGLYDPTLLDALVAAGYDRDFAELTDVENLPLPATPWNVPGDAWPTIERDAYHHTVTLAIGVRLDLSGTAKGWAASRAADMLASLGPCLINAGGDLAVRGALPGAEGWTIGVNNPGDEKTPLTSLEVSDCGVATSGIDYRHWTREGIVQHHLIDPRTQRPAATDLLTATVIAPDAALADLYALIVMLLGHEQGLAFLEHDPELDGLLIDRDGRQWWTSNMKRYQKNQDRLTDFTDIRLDLLAST